MKRAKWAVLIAGAAILAMVPAVAQTSLPAMPPAKAGLYEVRKFSNMAMFIAHDFSNTPAEEQQKQSAAALARPGPVFQVCVPQDGAKLLNTIAGIMPGCTYSNVATTGTGFSADVVCTGTHPAHITFDVPAPDHRVVTVSGQPMPKSVTPLIDKYEIAWVSSDCGELPAGAVRLPNGKIITPQTTKQGEPSPKTDAGSR